MEIQNNKAAIEGMNLGKFSEKREEILKEMAPEMQTLDSFKKAGDCQLDSKMKCMDLGQRLVAILNPEKPLPASSLEMENYMIPCNEGKVAHMCLTMGHLGNALPSYMNAFKTFLEKMPSAKFTVLASTRMEFREMQKCVEEWGQQGAIQDPGRVQLVDTGKDLSIWAQDSTLVVGNKVVEQDRAWFPGRGDGAVAEELAKANPEVEYQRMEGIFIDGGNQLATRKTIFAGTDAVAFMLKDMKQYPAKYEKIACNLGIEGTGELSKEDLSKMIMERTFPHQEMVIVGYKGEQPAFHIDMAITPLGKADPETGKPVMTIGDPSMAIRILEDVKAESPEKYQEYESRIRNKVGCYSDHPLDEMIEGVRSETNIQENFDAVAKGMEKDGFKVERVPYLGSSSLRGLPWITYNNSVIDGDNIFIPNFDIPELDKAGNGVYEKYGYNPVPIDMTEISTLQGAINCITKVVERKYA